MNITVFLADDHAVVRDGLRMLLEAESDISVVGDVANGREAVRQVAQLRPDVVVMDITMPELNGIEATREIRRILPSAQVIILSIHSAPEHIYRSLEAGARGYLLKESAGTEVARAVRAVYNKHRYLSQKISDCIIDDYVQHSREPSGRGAIANPLARLSHREREILQLVVEGGSSKAIAGELSLSPKTVETYRSRLMRKLGIGDIPGLVKFAVVTLLRASW